MLFGRGAELFRGDRSGNPAFTIYDDTLGNALSLKQRERRADGVAFRNDRQRGDGSLGGEGVLLIVRNKDGSRFVVIQPNR